MISKPRSQLDHFLFHLSSLIPRKGIEFKLYILICRPRCAVIDWVLISTPSARFSESSLDIPIRHGSLYVSRSFLYVSRKFLATFFVLWKFRKSPLF